MTIRLYNTKTKKKQDFARFCLTMCAYMRVGRLFMIGFMWAMRARLSCLMFWFACYDRIANVTYVRNITDVDDKINARAAERGISIAELCEQTIISFHEDCHALAVLPPDKEPRATDHIGQMIEMITTLIEKGFAYEAEGHVLFSVEKMPNMASYLGERWMK